MSKRRNISYNRICSSLDLLLKGDEFNKPTCKIRFLPWGWWERRRRRAQTAAGSWSPLRAGCPCRGSRAAPTNLKSLKCIHLWQINNYLKWPPTALTIIKTILHIVHLPRPDHGYWPVGPSSPWSLAGRWESWWPPGSTEQNQRAGSRRTEWASHHDAVWEQREVLRLSSNTSVVWWAYLQTSAHFAHLKRQRRLL